VRALSAQHAHRPLPSVGDAAAAAAAAVHYCVANMPGAVPCTSTLALTNATLPYALRLADQGWRAACAACPELRGGLSVARGRVVHRRVAEAWGLECADALSVAAEEGDGPAPALTDATSAG
jgi:alanine dehydrogenase